MEQGVIEIRYCGVCGDTEVVEKMEGRLSELGEVETVECGSCELSVRAEDEEVFNEREHVMDLTGIFESVRRTVEV